MDATDTATQWQATLGRGLVCIRRQWTLTLVWLIVSHSLLSSPVHLPPSGCSRIGRGATLPLPCHFLSVCPSATAADDNLLLSASVPAWLPIVHLSICPSTSPAHRRMP